MGTLCEQLIFKGSKEEQLMSTLKHDIKHLRALRASIDYHIGAILDNATLEKGPNCGGPTRREDLEERLWELFDNIRKGIEGLPL
jgi:hypothetical protein